MRFWTKSVTPLKWLFPFKIKNSHKKATSANEKVFIANRLDLSEYQIRVLQILPGAWDSPLRCKLSVCRQDEAEYEALSYCWGSQSRMQEITVDGLPFLVTSNLYSALRHLRHSGHPRLFWIDAICINQYSDLERNHQVQMMRQIYENAEQTTIWLGEEDDGPSDVFKDLSAMASADELSPDKMQRLSKLVSDKHKAIQDILRLPWWERIWVLQEIVRSRHVLIQYRRHCLEWRCFMEIFKWEISDSPDVVPAEQFARKYLPQLQKFQARSDVSKYALLELVLMFRHRLASDPRDKIYGLLGLLASNDLHAEADPDYSKSVEDTYIEFARSHMNETLLCSAEYGSCSTIQVPSWCPNWSVNKVRPTPFLASGIKTGSIGEPIPIKVKDCQMTTLLSLDAWIIDKVQAVGEPASTVQLTDDVESSWINLAAGSGHSKVTCSRCSRVLRPGSHDFSKIWRCAVEGDFVNNLWLEDWESEEHNVAKAMTCINRRFFLSTKGFMGFGPTETQPSDLLCTLAEKSKIVFIFRKSKEIYQLIGHCFMHGVFDSQNAQRLAIKQCKVEELIIK